MKSAVLRLTTAAVLTAAITPGLLSAREMPEPPSALKGFDRVCYDSGQNLWVGINGHYSTRHAPEDPTPLAQPGARFDRTLRITAIQGHERIELRNILVAHDGMGNYSVQAIEPRDSYDHGYFFAADIFDDHESGLHGVIHFLQHDERGEHSWRAAYIDERTCKRVRI